MEIPTTANKFEKSPLKDELDMHLNRQTALCDALEEIADALPDQVNTQKCLQIARSIYPIIKAAHEFEEKRLFPVIAQTHGQCFGMLKTIERLHSEHWEDESYGQELTEVLKEFVAGKERNVDKLAYMLRGFFEGLRRHIAFEKEMLSPQFKA